MAYVVRRPNGSWEIRESRLTEAGPRARTLATFRELTADVLERARARASVPIEETELRRAAARAGAPVAVADVDRAARELLAQLGAGRRLAPALRRQLAHALRRGSPEVPEYARWIGADPEERGEALRDLLLPADSLPRTRRPPRLRFPRLQTRVA